MKLLASRRDNFCLYSPTPYAAIRVKCHSALLTGPLTVVIKRAENVKSLNTLILVELGPRLPPKLLRYAVSKTVFAIDLEGPNTAVVT